MDYMFFLCLLRQQDRRVLNSYLNQFYCEEALSTPNYVLSPLPTYYIPDNGTLQSYRDYIHTLPTFDRPEAFGQHPNADISYQIEDSKIVLDSLLNLQPQDASEGGDGGPSREEIVKSIAKDILEQVPAPFNLEEVMKAKSDDPSALHVVLFQEIERYNMLLVKVCLPPSLFPFMNMTHCQMNLCFISILCAHAIARL
jgi:dynein heavy chain